VSKDGFAIAYGAGIISAVLALKIITVIHGSPSAELRKQAIERGHAEYVVGWDGKTTWQWKETK